MFKALHFKNFKSLKKATLPLGRFTLLVGPNGSGKSTALQGFRAIARPDAFSFSECFSSSATDGQISVAADWSTESAKTVQSTATWDRGGGASVKGPPDGLERLRSVRVFNLSPLALASPCSIQPQVSLQDDGAVFPAYLDHFRDTSRDSFSAFEAELSRLMPEFDQVQFEVVETGKKAFSLRQKLTGKSIASRNLSQGTILAVAFLSLAYAPSPPCLIALEEPDRGLHPRLLRDIQAALFRLAYPEEFGETRAPTQVIATTHNPYFVDLFKDHPEDIVVANKVGTDATFERIADREHYREILDGAPLGEIWYSGVLGGVPADR